MLVETSSFVGAGLDSSSARSVIRAGFTTSMLDLIIEMCRHVRNHNDDGTNPEDFFSSVLTRVHVS